MLEQVMKIKFCKRFSKLIFLALVSAFFPVNNSMSEDKSVLKTLFFTQAERVKIDESRFKSAKYIGDDYAKRNEPGNGTLNNEKNKKKEKENLKIDGYVKREDGKNVIWFNNTNTLKSNNANQGIKFKPRNIDGRGINLVSKSKLIKLKPGQILQIDSGKIQEQYKMQDSTAKMKIDKK